MANGSKYEINLKFNADMTEVQRQLQQLMVTLNNITSGKGLQGQALTTDLNKAVSDASKLQAILKNTTLKNGNLDLGAFRQELKKSNLTVEEIGSSLMSLGPKGAQAFSQLSQSILSAEIPLKRTSTLLSNFATTLKNTAKWQISSSLLHGFMGSIQSAYGYAQDLNESLNNIRIVSKQNTEQMADFANEANKAAKELSVTTTAYTDAALIFYQQGLKGEEVTERTDVVAKMSNVTKDSVDEVSSYMTAIWNNFDDGSESLEHYADVITGLGAATASSSAEIAAGLEKFAAVADTVGLSYDYATSSLATVVAQTRQSADTVGTAFKTLFARIEGLKLGKTLEDGVDLNKYSAALNTIGVNILDANGQLRNMDDILDDMGAKWNQIGREQQVALAQTVAGTRQYNQLIALMDNWDKVQDNLQVARSSDGELQKQADIYAESWEAAQKRVKASAQAIYSDLIDDKFFINFSNNFAKVLDGIDKVIKSLGGLKTIIPALSVGLINLFSKDLGNGINNFIYNLQVGTKSFQEKLIDFKEQMNQVFGDYGTTGNIKNDAVGYGLQNQLIYQQALIEKEKERNRLGIETSEIEKSIQQAQLDQIINLNEELRLAGELADKARLQYERSEKAIDNQLYSSGIGDQYSSTAVRFENGEVIGVTIKEQIQDVINLNAQVEKYNEILDLLPHKASEIFEDSGNFVKRLIENFQELDGQLNLTEGDGEQLGQLFSKLYSASSVEEVGMTLEELRKKVESLNIEAEEAQKALNEAINSTNASAEDQKETIDRVTEAIKKLKEQTEATGDVAYKKTNSDNATNNAVNDLNKQTLIAPDFGKTFTSATSAVMGFGTALRSIDSLFNTLNNKEATFGDKLLAILTSGSMAIMMLGNSAKGLITAFTPLVKNVEVLTTINKVTTTDLEKQLGLIMAQNDATSLRISQEQAGVLLEKIKSGEEIAQTGEEAKQLSLLAIEKGLQSDQIGILTALVALSKLETTEEEKQIILQQIRAKLQGKLSFKGILSGLKNVGSSLTSIIGTLGTVGVVLGVVVAAVAAAVIAYQAYRNHLKAVAEEATNTAKKEQEKLQTIKEETQAIDDLTSKYAELNAQLSEMGEENARAEMFKMAVQARQTDLAIKALASSFKTFGDILDDVAQEQNKIYQEQAKATVQASQNAVYANLRTVKEKYTDNFGETIDIGKGTFGGQNREFNKQLQEQFGLVVDDTGHINTDDFIKVLTTNQDKFVDFINSSSSKNAKNLQEIYGEIKDSAGMLKEAGAAYSDSVEKTLVSSKKKSIAEIKTLKDYEKIKRQLIEEASQTELFEYNGVDSLKEQNDWARDLILKQETLNDRLEKQLYLQDQILEKQNVSQGGTEEVSLTDFVKSGNTLTEASAYNLISGIQDRIYYGTGGTNNGMTSGLLVQYLTNGLDSVPEQMRETYFKALAIIEENNDTVFKVPIEVDEESLEEDKKELQEKIDELNDDQLNYVTLNIDRFSSVQDLERILNGDFKERIEAFTQREGIVTLSTAIEDLDLSKKKNTGFDSEQIHGFFDYNDKINGYDEGQFAGLETSQQLYNIMQGVDEMAANYAEHRKEAKVEAEQELEILKQQQNQLKREGADDGINSYVKKVQDSGIETDIKTFDDMVDFLDRYNDALTEQGPELDKFVNTNKELLDVLGLSDKVDKKHIESLVRKGKLYRENQIAIQHTEEEIASYNEEIEYQIDKLQAAKQMYLAVNKEMDSLQDAYKTIKGAQDEWNKEGYLTMDTVQSLISLDNAYMSTLEVTANGIKMNEEAYVGVTQAKYASLAASIALQAQEIVNQYVNGNLTASELMKEMQMYASADASYSAADAALAEARATLAAKAANDEYAATIGNYLDAVEKKINLLKQAGSQVNTGNVGNVLGYSPKGGGGGKGKSKETKDLKEYADEFDRFYPFQKVIDDLADAMNDLAKAQEHMAGGELVGALRKQNRLLQEQKKAYQDLAKEQKAYQKEMQMDLAKYGVSFDTFSGNIVNYADATNQALEQYNAAIEKYNKSAQSDADKKALEAVEKEYEKFKKLLSNYQNILTEIQDTENNLDDIYYETIANNLKEFEIMVQVKLDIGEARRMVNDFLSEINKNFKTLKKSTKEWLDLFDNALKNAKTYVDGDLGTINVDLEALNKVKNAIDTGDYGHEGAMFASETEAITKYKELAEQLKDDAQDLYDLYRDAWEDYIDAIDESIEAWEEILNNFDDINDTLDHYEKLVELIHGYRSSDQGYDALVEIYNQQIALHTSKIAAVNKEIEALEKEKQELLKLGAKETDEDIQKINQAIQDGLKTINDSREAYLEALNKSFKLKLEHENKNAINKALGFDIDILSEQWEKATKAEKGYYDENQRIYQLDKLRRKYNETINNTKDLKIQQKLAEMRDKELEDLEKKNNLSEGDLEIAEKKLAVEEARIALEEAQNNKSQMRLRRDSQGNWSYQFVSDEEDLEDKKQKLMDASNDLYNTTKNNEKDLIDEIREWVLAWREERNSLDEKDFATREEYLAELNRIDEYYSGEINKRVATLNGYRQQQTQATANLLLASYESNTENYEIMTEAQKRLIDELRDQSIQDLADIVTATEEDYEGIREVTEEVNQEAIAWWDQLKDNCQIDLEQMQRANDEFAMFFNGLLEDYENKLRELSEVGGLALDDIRGAAEAVGDEIDNVSEKVEDCVDRTDALSDFRERLNEIEEAWNSVKDAITDALSELENYLSKLLEVKEMQDVVRQNATDASAPDFGSAPGTGDSGNSGTGRTPGGGTTSPGDGRYDGSTDVIMSLENRESSSTGLQQVFVKSAQGKSQLLRTGVKTEDYLKKLKEFNQGGFVWGVRRGDTWGFDTGGYTGTWSSTYNNLLTDANNGRLAWLHQKELVLNQTDTKNILDAVQAIRGAGSGYGISEAISRAAAETVDIMSNSIDMITHTVTEATHAVVESIMTAAHSGTLEQNVHIDASFPDATDRYEIELAFDNLVNIASQRILEAR